MSSVTYTTIIAGVGDFEKNTHVIDRACEMARLCDATLLLVAGFDPVSARDKDGLLYTSPSPRDRTRSRMPSYA